VDAPVLSFRRKLVFAGILAVFTAALVLAMVELGLRIAGFGHATSFVRRAQLADGTEVWRENRWCTAPYFSPELVRRPVPFRLPVEKSPRAYRVFVLGSSAAMGDPEASFSLARMLEAMLRAAYPEIEFEVVNAGITAINSHVLRGIAADCARLQPDLFIVYEGNNEVIGPFGPAGVFAPFFRSHAALRLAATLKVTRTGQAIGALTRSLQARGGSPDEWRGMQMFLEQRIAADDPRLDAVREHFARNLEKIIAHARDAGASTLLCTVLTNQRDFPPFLSVHAENLTPAQRAEWQAHFDRGKAAFASGDIDAARDAFEVAAAIDDSHAELTFRRGRLELLHGDVTRARELLQRAADLDALRFRTDRALNDTIRTVARNHAGAAELVDLVGTVGARSRGGIPGDDLLYEHVHLTFRGTYEVARELFPRIAADLQRRGLADSRDAPFDYDEARVRLGFTAYEQAMIAFELLGRFQGAPFVDQPDGAARIQAWTRRVEIATQLLSQPGATDALLAAYAQAREWSPHDWILARNAGAMLVARGEPAAALPLLQEAERWIDDDIDTLIALARAHEALGAQVAADAAYARARALDSRYPGLPPAK